MSHVETLASGGAGGGPNPGSHEESHAGDYSLSAVQIALQAHPPIPPFLPQRPVVSILAAGHLVPDGLVEVRGGLGVRVTAGPPPPVGPPASNATANGVEIATGPLGSISLERGLLPVDQKIEMTPTGIKINAGSMPVEVESLTSITLSVAGGVTKIKLGPEGVTIEGLTLRLSASILAEIKGTLTTVQATAVNKISGAVTMIG